MNSLQPPQELTYEPLGTVPATEHTQRRRRPQSGKRVECPCCGTIIAAGAVVTDKDPEWDVDLECMVGVRATYCDPCHHIMKWREIFFNGKPTGEVVTPGGAPGLTSGDDNIARFLAAHPECQGVEQG